MAEIDEVYIRRTFQLALLGIGKVAPNPLVGCVIVHPQEGIIGEGWHAFFGGPHAEVNAVLSVSKKELLPGCTAYVNLETCSHFGKTPPCADLLVQHGIKNVVVCNLDPNPLVAGKGIEKLEKNGCSVKTGVLEKEGRYLNRFFFTSQEKGRPFITLKWAQTQDGFIARNDGSSKWISSPLSRLWVHKMRSEHQSILAGTNTLLMDNPSLNVRGWKGQNPIRLVLDRNLKLPGHLNVFSDGLSDTWIFNSVKQETHFQNRYILFPNPSTLPELFSFLWKEGIGSVFVEGGSALINAFMEANLWDEAVVFTSIQAFEAGLEAPKIQNARLQSVETVGVDVCRLYSGPT